MALSFLSQKEMSRIRYERQKAYEAEQLAKENDKNRGGFFGGLGYAFEKIGLGLMSAVEGIWDYTAGGLAKFFGADEWAEEQFANDWVNYGHADEWYNPDNGWKTVGDITQGIGNSIPSLIAIGGVTLATGGAALPAVVAKGLVGGATFLTAGLSAAGNATKEAYRQTGELGGKEFGYGALVGGLEGAVETFSDAFLGGVGGQLSKGIRSLSGDVAASAARQTFGKTLAKSFLSEGFEEVVGEFADPFFKRWTYDPTAENATLGELAYAGFVGGMSGLIMSAGGAAYSNARILHNGSKAVTNGRVNEILQNAQNITSYEAENHTDMEAFKSVSDTYKRLQESLKKTNGNVETVRQKHLLGILDIANTAAIFEPTIQSSAQNIYANADAIAERMTEFGYADESGKPIVVTADQIREGIDAEHGEKAFRKSFSRALRTNSVLRTIAVLDATNKLLIDAKQFSDATMRGRALASQVDLNRFLEATESEEGLKQRAAVAQRLGIQDWNTLTAEELNQKIEEFSQDGGPEEYRAERTDLHQIQSIAPEAAQELPASVVLEDGAAVRYSLGENQFAVERRGDNYRVYDYTNGLLTKNLTQAELDSFVSELHNEAAQKGMARFSLQTSLEGKQIVVIDTAQDIFYDVPRSQYGKTVREYMKRTLRGKVVEGVKFTRASENEYTNSRGSQKLYNQNDGTYDAKMRAGTELDNLVRTGEFIGHEDAKHERNFNKDGYNRYRVTFELNGKTFTGEMLVALSDGKSMFYDIVKIKEKSVTPISSQQNARQKGGDDALLTDSVAQNSKKSTVSEGKSSQNLSAQEIDAYARQNVDGYNKLGGANQSMIRSIIRQGRAHGISETDIRSYARVAAHTGVNIVFDKSKCYVAANAETGEPVYSDGYYDAESNQIVVNPQSTRTAESLLLHEFTHALQRTKGGRALLKLAYKNMSKDDIKTIVQRYLAAGRTNAVEIRDEIPAHYAEGILSSETILDRLLADKPNARARFLDFFKRAKTVYASDKQLSREASRLYKQYKKWFDKFSSANAFSNASEGGIYIQKQGKKKTAAQSRDTAKSINYALMNEKSFTENVKEVLSMSDARAIRNKNLGNYVSVMKETPAVIRENVAGAENLEVIIRFDALYLAARESGVLQGHYHALGEEIVSNLPQYLSSPDAIVRLDNGRINLFTQFETKNGKNGIISVELGTVKDINSKHTKYNLVVSAFGAKDNYIKNLVSRDGTSVEYMKKDLPQVNPQLYEWLSSINGKPFTNSIAQKSRKSTDYGKKDGKKRFALPAGHKATAADNAYLEALNNGDVTAAQQIIDKAARDAGYTDEIYHGTEQFGFTKFDPTIGDDGISVFATSDASIAESYGYNIRQRKISEKISNPSNDKLIELLKEKGFQDIVLLEKGDVAKRMPYVEKHLSSAVDAVKRQLDQKDHYEKSLSDDFAWYADHFRENHSKNTVLGFIELADRLSRDYGVWNKSVSDLRLALSVFSKLDEDIFFSVKDEVAFNREDAIERAVSRNGGVYKLFGMKGKRLTVDGKGANWSGIRTWLNPQTAKTVMANANLETNKFTLEDEGGVFFEQDLSTFSDMAGDVWIALVDRYGGTLGAAVLDQIRDGVRNSSSVEVKVRAFGTYKTRDIARFAKENGYDSVLIKNIHDNGGRGASSNAGDVYIYFDGNMLKSADAVTYDDDGKVIPPSRRFQKSNPDIRYALPETDSNGSTLSEQQRRYFKDSKVVDKDGRLQVVYHATNAIFTQVDFKKGSQGLFWFTSSKANFENGNTTAAGVRDGSRVRVMELYADIEKPAGWDEYDKYGIDQLQHMGYDGAILDKGDGTFDGFVFKSANQVKSVDNKSPTKAKDIRFALSENGNSRRPFSRGQRAKFTANNTRFKVYSRVEAQDVINSIIDERLDFGDRYGYLSGKSKEQVIDMLFQKLNSTPTGYQIGVALDIADYIIENAYLEDMYAAEAREEAVSEAMGTLSILRSYMHRMDLRGIKGEIQYRYDKKNTINLVWGAKEGGIAPDQVAQELESYGIYLKAINEADQFFEMLDMYESARATVNERAEKEKLSTYGGAEQIESLRQDIARDILRAYDTNGSQSKFAKLVEQYNQRIESLKREVREAGRRNKLTNSIIDTAQYLRDIATKRKYVGADVFSAPELTTWLKNLGRMKYRSDLRKAGARQILLDYGKFYNTGNPLLYDADAMRNRGTEDNVLGGLENYIDQNVLDAIDFLRENEGSAKPLSTEELQAAQVIMLSAKHLFDTYDQIIMEGKKVSVTELAAQGNEILQKSKNHTGVGVFNTIYGVMNKIIEPRAVIRSLEDYDPHGVLTRAYKAITDGETAAGLRYIELMTNFDDFFAEHKKYNKRLSSTYITVAGADLTVGQAVSLYELSKREQAKEGLYEAGFGYMDRSGAKKSARITESDIAALEKQFTAEDKEFISIVEDFFNVQSKELKTKADMQILGYTNAADEFYFPIKRDQGTIARNITDARSIMADWANVYNFSFNKDVRAGAKNKLFITGVYDVVTRHAKQLSTYAELTVPLKNFAQIYAKNIGTKTNVVSMRNTLNEQIWGKADNYLSKLFKDIQGTATSNSMIEKLRSAYAKYQLGANLKVIVSQITSYPTAGIYLDVPSMVRGAVMRTNWAAMDQYCPYARVRNYERGIVRAEGVVDKVGKVGDVLTKPIQWTDRATIGKLWNACQVQIERNGGAKVGTRENMEQAGVLLEDVIRLTQPNYTNTERSELMRHDSDIVRSFTMFTSVPLKQLSRFVESIGEYRALQRAIKSGNADTDTRARYQQSSKRLRRTLGSITIANLMYCLVGQFFKWLYDKDRKDKDGNEIGFVQDFFNDFVSTSIGMFPIVRDIYNYFANDYEFNNFAIETVNNILSASQELFDLATKAAGGEVTETSDYMKALRNSLYAIGQLTGLPFRNINNLISGLVKRFDPAAAYEYNSLFYNAKYSSDMKAALEKGDTKLADTIMALLLDERGASGLSDTARAKMIELYEKGYDVLPRTVGDKITFNGETRTISAKERETITAAHEAASAEIDKIVSTRAFQRLSETAQAKAIKKTYESRYEEALAGLYGVPVDDEFTIVSKAIGITKAAPIIARAAELTSERIGGQIVQGSRKSKVVSYLQSQSMLDAERLLLLYYLGYKIGDGEYKGMSAKAIQRLLAQYITQKKLSREEKTTLAEMCGLTVKNGRIYLTAA